MVNDNAIPTKQRHKIVLIKNIVRSMVWPKYCIFLLRCLDARVGIPMKSNDGPITMISNAINMNKIKIIPCKTPSAPYAKNPQAFGIEFFRFQFDISAKNPKKKKIDEFIFGN